MVILENIDIDIGIDKAILQNIDIDEISNRFKFGISNRASQIPLNNRTFWNNDHVEDGVGEVEKIIGEQRTDDYYSGWATIGVLIPSCNATCNTRNSHGKSDSSPNVSPNFWGGGLFTAREWTKYTIPGAVVKSYNIYRSHREIKI